MDEKKESENRWRELKLKMAVNANYADYLALESHYKQYGLAESSLKKIKIALLRNFTVEPLLPILFGELIIEGFIPEFYLSDFDALIATAIKKEGPLYQFNPDFIFLMQWPETLSQKLFQNYISATEDEKKEEWQALFTTQKLLLKSLRENSSAPIISHNLPLLSRPTLGIHDLTAKDSTKLFIEKLNHEWCNLAESFPNLYFCDWERLWAHVGRERGYDERYKYLAAAPLSKEMLVSIGQESIRFIKALKGKSKKCLVLDCDNTLWGGVVGEEGVDGVKLGPNHPAVYYQNFQKEILNFYNRGVILALCSKNNEEDVWNLFHHHKSMILKKEHISAYRINWNNKAQNIRELAQELNLGLDSFVFMDDSPFECEMVSQAIPEVTVIRLPENPLSYRTLLLNGGWFDTLTYSQEDQKRGQMYHAEKERQQLKDQVGNWEDYLKSLKLKAQIEIITDKDIPRVAQLTQKTNQFNLTTKRYSESDIIQFAQDSHSQIYTLKLEDRFGDLGLVGVAILKYHSSKVTFDTLLMSCRALGRGVEDCFFIYLIEEIKQNPTYRTLEGIYIPTAKNSQVANFYQKWGFTSEDQSTWASPIDKFNQTLPNWILLNDQ